MGKRFGVVAVLIICMALIASACDSGDDSTGDDGGGDGDYRTLEVPGDYDTIQAAVDDASAGDLVLVDEGVYKEAVTVPEGTDNIVIRGTDRNKVILDGEFEKENGIFVVGANGVAVENMTARNYTANGFFWTGVEGYRGSYLTAYRNGDYGIYAFDSVTGQFDNSLGSGSPDAGFYIGQCYPCDAVLDNVIGEFNGLGYSGTDAGGNLIIANSTFRNNRAGIVPNTGAYELCYPQRDMTIVGNKVYDNNYGEGPAVGLTQDVDVVGSGVLVGGGIGNTIERNQIYDNDLAGVLLTNFPETGAADDVPGPEDRTTPCSEYRERPLPDPSEIPEVVIWPTAENTIVGNEVSGSEYDLAIALLDEAYDNGNCFADNVFTTSGPANIEQFLPCEGEGTGSKDDSPFPILQLAEAGPPAGDYKTTPEPDDQENMPDASSAPPVPATPDNVPMQIDVDSITLPSKES